MYYAIKICGRYFKDYVYLNASNRDRYAGNTGLGSVLQDGDIVDVITTEHPERLEVARSIGNTIAVLCGIERLRDEVITIEPRTCSYC